MIKYFKFLSKLLLIIDKSLQSLKYAVLLKIYPKLLILPCLICIDLNLILVILLISVTTDRSNPFLVLSPVPTAVPP